MTTPARAWQADPHVSAVVERAKALVDAVTFDDQGVLVGGVWQGGNGGMLGRDTLKCNDELRKALLEIGVRV